MWTQRTLLQPSLHPNGSWLLLSASVNVKRASRQRNAAVFLAPAVNSASTFPDDKAETPAALGQLLWERTGQYLCFSCVCLYLCGPPVDVQSPVHPQPRLLPWCFSLFQCCLDCCGLCSFLVVCAPSLSYCWHVHRSVGWWWKLCDCQSSKQHFCGEKKLKSQPKFDWGWCIPPVCLLSTAFTFVSCFSV